MNWHVEPRMLEAYAVGLSDDAYAYSIEAHLLECEVCRNFLSSRVNPEALDGLWENVRERTVYAPKRQFERLLLRVGVSDHVARLLTATPSLHFSWFVGIAAVLAFAIAAAYLSANGFIFFLILAPLLPLAGIAVAYGPGVDPTYEVGVAAPMQSFHLLLIRTSAVLVTSGGLALVAAIALPQPTWAVVAWLLPAMGLVLVTLALSTWISPLRSGASVATLWIVACVMGVVYADRTPATVEGFFAIVQVIVAVLATTAGMLVMSRRETFDQRRRA